MTLPIEFGHPWALLLLALLAPIVYLAWTTRAPLAGARWWVSTVLRIVLVVLLAMSLADVRWARRSNDLCVFFLVDASKSAGPQATELAQRTIAAEVATMQKDDRFGVIVFGQRPLLARAMGVKDTRFELPAIDPRVADFTNIGRAIRFAVSQFPRDCRKRLVILSDGNENLGNAVDEARAASANDIDIVVSPLAVAHAAEVLVESVVTPTRARPDQPIDLKANIRSSKAADVKVKVYRDSELIGEGSVMLEEGPNIVHLANDAISDPGFHRYEVLIEPPPGADTVAVNNTGLAYTQVYGEARVLYLEGDPEHSRALRRALESSAAGATGGFKLVSGTMMDVPQSIEQMNTYDCIILSNISRNTMSDGQLASLKNYVEELGGGLIMLGGERSLTTGGYLGTPVEEVLPVDLHLDRERHLASLAMVIVVDQSGSMGMPAASGGATKMDLANQACADAISLLQDVDEAGVVMVDTAPKWVSRLKYMTAANKARLRSDVLANRPGGGGIFVMTGLHAAYSELKHSVAQTKHVILFADASDSEQQEGCIQRARDEFKTHNITLTVVGLGTSADSDAAFLRTLADNGGGRYYITNNAHDLPEIFTKDTYIVSRNAIVEVKEGFKPALSSMAEMIDNISWASAPRLYGYVATAPKPKGELLLLAPNDEPLLARWRTGLGKSVAFTSDAKDKWAKDWTGWAEFDRFWSQVVRWTLRDVARGNVSTQVVVDGSRVRVLVDAVNEEGEFVNGETLSARVIAPDPAAKPQKVAFHQIAPGRYEATFEADATGSAYQVVVVDEKDEKIVDSAGAVLSYPPEYRTMETDEHLLQEVADAAHGRLVDPLAGSFQRRGKPVSALRSVWAALVAVGLGLLVLDVAARRLVLPGKVKEQASKKMGDQADVVLSKLRATRAGLRHLHEGGGGDEEITELVAVDRAESGVGERLLGGDDAVNLKAADEGGGQEEAPGGTAQLLKARQRARREGQT